MEKKKENPGVKNPALLLAKKLQENRGSLHISRLPTKTKEEFIALAEKEFCGDYGMTLKWLLDDILSQDTRMIIARVQDHEIRIQTLESTNHLSKETSDEDTRKMVDGSKKVVRRSKKNG